MAGRADDEDYWNDSETKNRAKAFNFEEDEFGGQLCGVTKSGTARLSEQVRAAFSSDTLSGSMAQINLKTPRKQAPPLLSLISEKSLNCILEAGKPPVWEAKGSLPSQEELRILRRQVEARWSPPDERETVLKIFLGHQYSLELYRSLKAKVILLDAAIELGDGDTIETIVFYLVRTLKTSWILQILHDKPDAASQYIGHFHERVRFNHQPDPLLDLLTVLGRKREAAMTYLKVIARDYQDPHEKLEQLRNSYTHHFSNLESRDKPLVENYVKLLEWQLAVNVKEVVGQPVLGSLEYLCRHHEKLPKSNLTSPRTLSAEQGINESQFQWTLLTVLASTQSWDDIEALLVTKGWMGGRKFKAAVPIERVIVELHSHGPPTAVLVKFIELIDNMETRVALARKLEVHRAVIDAFTAQRDRQAVVGYKATLHPQSDDYLHAENVLRATTIRWKN